MAFRQSEAADSELKPILTPQARVGDPDPNWGFALDKEIGEKGIRTLDITNFI